MKLQYTAMDFDLLFSALKSKAQELFPEWTDFNLSNLGTVLLELFGTLGDQLYFYQNNQCNEMFLSTVRRLKNAIKILKRMDYAMGGRIAASVDETIYFPDGPHAKNVIIKAGRQISTEDGQYIFETVQDLTIPAGNPNGVISVKNWTTQIDSLSFAGVCYDKKYLQEKNFIEVTTLEIDGFIWTQVDDFLDSGPEDRHFIVEIDNELNAILIFGDGTNGHGPEGSGTCTYKTGGGKAANSIQPGKISQIIGTVYDIDGDPVAMSALNSMSPSGGDNEESIDEARKKAPKASREQKVTVGREDYEANTEQVSGVARALALGKREDSTIYPARVQVIVVPEGGGLPSSVLKQSVADHLYIGKPVMMTTIVEPVDPLYNIITISGTVIKKDGFMPDAVKAAIDAAIIQYFAYDNLDEENNYTVDFGYYMPTLYHSILVDLIMSAKIKGAKCVKSTTITSPTGDVAIAMREIPSLASLSGLVVI